MGCGSLTQLGTVAVLPQADILCIQEPKGLNFKGGEKQKRMTFVTFQWGAWFISILSVHTTHFSL